MDAHPAKSPLQRRQAGLLLHPTSLPGPGANGVLGAEAYRFVDFLAAAGFSIWQILPLGPTHEDFSPYQSLSAHAGNPDLICLQTLVEAGWLEAAALEPMPRSAAERAERLTQAYAGFQARAATAQREELARFIEQQGHWLEDYALFCVIKAEQQGRPWNDWPVALRDRHSEALTELGRRQGEALDRVRFEQFLFFRQWQALKAYANERDIAIFGDMPIFVAQDSADVWARRQCFLLDESGQPKVVAGVPPDYFSETGQRWGNPHYDWDWLAADGFGWWLQRMEDQLALFDLVRIDHFRGFEAYWEVPAHEETAINGRWVKAPGDALFERLHEHFDPLPVIAEDLGTIDEAVVALRDKYALPGMKILQFAFDSDAANPYLPHHHVANSVVYTGTHDNDTTLGWYEGAAEPLRQRLAEYLGQPAEAMPWPLVRTALASVARLAVLPLQDVLALGSEHRMNVPGTTEGNWRWRFDWAWLEPELAPRLRHMLELYGRLPQ